MKTNERISIHEVVNANGKKTTCKVNGTKVRFSFDAAKKHFSTGLTRHISKIEGRWIAKNEKLEQFGVAQFNQNNVTDSERANRAFLMCRTALQKGKMPKCCREKVLKDIIFSANFAPVLGKCELRTGYHSDKLLKAVSMAVYEYDRKRKSNKK